MPKPPTKMLFKNCPNNPAFVEKIPIITSRPIPIIAKPTISFETEDDKDSELFLVGCAFLFLAPFLFPSPLFICKLTPLFLSLSSFLEALKSTLK